MTEGLGKSEDYMEKKQVEEDREKKNKLLDWKKQKMTYKRPSEFLKTENR